MTRWLPLTCLLLAMLAHVARADDAEQYQKIRELLQDGKVAAAEKVFQEAIKESPDSQQLKSLHYLLYAYNNRDENYPAAIEHLEAHIDNLLPSAGSSRDTLTSLPYFLDALVSLYERSGKQDVAGRKLDELLKKVEAAGKQGNASAQLAARQLRNKQLLLLVASGHQEQARQQLAERVSSAEKAVKDDPDNTAALLDLVFALKSAGEVAQEAGDDDADEKRQAFLDRLLEAAGEHRQDAALVNTALAEYVSAISGMARKQPLEAEKLLEKLQKFAASIESDDPMVKSRLASIDRSAASLKRIIEGGKVHAELIGKEAFPLTAEAWVNGTPLTDADLKGKVVLLDFWAVWCGPCIATFPHLREWREQYHDKGLVIIGVTRYYEYGWNEEAGRSERKPGISHEDEQAALEKFAQHYKLEHRFMITPEDAMLQKSYGVSGIPQAVLIDREGKIRLIRVGSGDANAHDIEKMLVELIGDGEK